MLTLEDCFGLCDLTEDEINAIAEHEHIPEIVALELAQYLVHLPKGEAEIRRMLCDDLAGARARGDRVHAAKLALIQRWFDRRCAAGAFHERACERA